jgi:hypothetical protein
MQSANFFFLKICGARALGLNCKKTAVIDSSLLVMHLDRLLEKVSPVLSWCTSSCVNNDFFGILQHDIFVLNCDVCCSFPLTEMLDAHRKHGGIGTLLVKKVNILLPCFSFS